MAKNQAQPAKGPKVAKSPKRKVPFQKSGAGIEAHGHVSELREHHDGSGVRMSVKHGKPKQQGDGLFDTYPDESSFTMPTDAAQQFSMGQRVRIRVHPHDDAPAKPAKKSGKSGKSGKSSKKKAPRQLYAD